MIIVGTKTDLRNDEGTLEKLKEENKKVVSQAQVDTMVQDLGALKSLECSALTRQGLKDVFDEALTSVLTNTPKASTKTSKKAKCSLL